MLLHQHFVSLLIQPLVSRPLSLLSNPTIQNSRFGCVSGGGNQLKKRESNFFSRRAVERESEFEVDPDKAREALRKLDEQLQSISQKQINRPKIKGEENYVFMADIVLHMEVSLKLLSFYIEILITLLAHGHPLQYQNIVMESSF